MLQTQKKCSKDAQRNRERPSRETESAKLLLNLLDILTVDNIYRLEVLKFSHSWLNGLLNTLEIFIDTTRDIEPNRIFISIELN